MRPRCAPAGRSCCTPNLARRRWRASTPRCARPPRVPAWTACGSLVSLAGADGPALLDGAAGLCASARPMLYFSCQIGGDANGADAWRQRLRALWASGYTGFWVFDNFGNPICEVTQPRVLDQMLDSLLRQNQRRASRTLYYYDVLAFGERDAGAGGGGRGAAYALIWLPPGLGAAFACGARRALLRKAIVGGRP